MTEVILRALFIGGSNDGKRMAVPDLPIISLPMISEMTLSSGIETEEYRKERIATHRRVFVVYVAQAISTESAMDRLLAYYTPIP